MRDFRKLEVWQYGHRITLRLYRLTAKFPREKLFGLTSQIRRCAASVAANIAEGCGRKTEGDFHRFLQIASGSASELDYHLLLARDLGYLPDTEYAQIVAELTSLRRKLTVFMSKVAGDKRSSTPEVQRSNPARMKTKNGLTIGNGQRPTANSQ